MRKHALLGLLLVSFSFFYSCKNDAKEETKEAIAETKTVPVKEKKERPTFNYTPKKPVNGKRKGVVELGASGFNSFIIEVDKEKNWELKSKEFGNSLVAEGLTSPEEVNTKLREYIQRIVEYGVDPKEIHFVISSGADKEIVTQVIKKELKNIGYIVNVVSAEEEGQYALKSVLPKRFEQIAFVVDIGSGNTKISYIKNNEVVALESYGSKYYQKKIEPVKAYTDVHKIASSVPQEKRSHYFILGGVPYQMANSLRNGNERFTVLDKDITAYKELADKKGEKVKSGLNIFNAINDATKPGSVIFDWDANFTIGFLLELPY